MITAYLIIGFLVLLIKFGIGDVLSTQNIADIFNDNINQSGLPPNSIERVRLLYYLVVAPLALGVTSFIVMVLWPLYLYRVIEKIKSTTL